MTEETGEQATNPPIPTPKELEAEERVRQVAELAQKFGFTETSQMRELRAPLIEAMAAYDHTTIKDLLPEYEELGEQVNAQLSHEDFPKGQIGLTITIGLVWREAGRMNSYANQLFNAHQYASYMEYEEAAIIEAAFNDVRDIFEAADVSKESEYVGPPTEEIVADSKQALPVELHDELDVLLTLPPDEAIDEVAALVEGYDLGETAADFIARMGWTEG